MSLGLPAEIKWPNDVLVRGRKVAGVLVEAIWSGAAMEAAVIGIGVNVLKGSAPPDGEALYPATQIEAELGREPKRLDVLREVVKAVIAWRARTDTPEFLMAWEGRLAFRGQHVTLIEAGRRAIEGTVLGLDSDGSLRLQQAEGITAVQIGEVHLRPGDDRMR